MLFRSVSQSRYTILKSVQSFFNLGMDITIGGAFIKGAGDGALYGMRGAGKLGKASVEGAVKLWDASGDGVTRLREIMSGERFEVASKVERIPDGMSYEDYDYLQLRPTEKGTPEWDRMMEEYESNHRQYIREKEAYEESIGLCLILFQ